MKKNICLIFFTAFSCSAIAQNSPIITDRPGQTVSPFTVPKKWIQTEAGFSKLVDKHQVRFKDILFDHPALLAKYGLVKNVELRLITVYTTSKGKEDNRVIDRQDGISSVQFGGKINFIKEKGIRPATALIAHYDFGGLRTLDKDTLDGLNFRLAMQHTISSQLKVGYNLGMQWKRFGFPPAYIYSFAPGYNFTEKWYGYIEAFGFIWKDKKPQHSIDGGIAYTINDDLKLDASGGLGISKTAPDYYVGIGVSFRFKAAK